MLYLQYIYLHLATSYCKCIGKYTIHGSYGIVRSLIEINSSKHCRHFTRYLDSSFFLRFPDVWMSGCLLGCFPVGESESAPPFRNLFALHLISLFWQVRVGTLVVRNRWTHHQTTRGKTLKTLFSSGYLLVWLTTIRVLHLQIPHDSFERPDTSSSGAMHCSPWNGCIYRPES